MNVTKIKITHHKTKQTFKAKGGPTWTIHQTNKKGDDLPVLKEISTEACVEQLVKFLHEAEVIEVQSDPAPVKKTTKTSKKTVKKKAVKKTPAKVSKPTKAAKPKAPAAKKPSEKAPAEASSGF